MPFINYSSREINCKIVYLGPTLSGKTTNIQYVYERTSPEQKGKLIVLPTEADRTLFFDFFPLSLGEIKGLKLRFHLYTVPGQVYYAPSRKLILKGADGIVFIADSSANRASENIESLEDLRVNLLELDYNLEEMPFTIQYNKRDLPDIMSVEDMNAFFNKSNRPYFEAVAIKGTGVFETLKSITRQVLSELKKNY